MERPPLLPPFGPRLRGGACCGSSRSWRRVAYRKRARACCGLPERRPLFCSLYRGIEYPGHDKTRAGQPSDPHQPSARDWARRRSAWDHGSRGGVHKADSHGLDSSRSATARPPVVRIMDYGSSSSIRPSKPIAKKSSTLSRKEVSTDPASTITTSTRRPGTRGGSQERTRQVTMMFRGRQIAHPELGRLSLTASHSSCPTCRRRERRPAGG